MTKIQMKYKTIIPSASDVKEARIALGFSAKEAASIVYRTTRNWQQWESGERKMDPALWELFNLKTRK